MVFFLADDLGWADVGYQLPEAARSAPGSPPTPHLNALAADGVVLRRLYAHKFCSPSRMAIQSGRAPIHVGVTNEGMVDFNLADAEGGFQGIPRHMTGLGAVMRRGGYATHFVGKWDAGTATFDHTPAGRGYGSSLFYFSHIIDAWSFETTLLYKAYDLYEQEVADDGTVLKSRPATGLLNRPGCSDESQDGCTHADSLFESRVSRIVAAHGVSSSTTSTTTTSSSNTTTTSTSSSTTSAAAAAAATRPLFLFWAPRLIHASAAPPWQSAEQRKRGQVYDVPAWALQASRNRSGIADGSCGSWCYLDACSPAEEVLRRKHAALSMLDGAVGRLQRQLQARGMWAHTLLVFMSDNGGNAAAAANNWPLRGGKSTDWEGGVRVPGFVGGGFVPPAARGRRVEGLMGAWDWYATLAALAGEDAHDALAEAHGLPAVDALDMGPMLFSTSAGDAAARWRQRFSSGVGSGGGDGNGEDGIGPRDSLVLGTTAGGSDTAVATRVGAVIAWVDGGGGEASGEAATSAAPTATATAGTTARRWLAGLINGTAGSQRGTAHGGGGRVLYKLVLGEGDEGAGSHAERRQHRWQAPSAATSSSSSSAASSSSSAASLSSSEGEAPGAGAGAGAGAAVSGRMQRRVTALMGQSVPGEFTDGNSHLYGFGPRLIDGTWCPKVEVPAGQRQPAADKVRCGRTLETGCLFDLTNDPGERFNLLWPGSRAEPGGGGPAGGGGGGGGGGGAAAAATPGVESAVGRAFARLLAIADKAQAGVYSPDRTATYRRDARGAGKPWLYYRNVDLHRANHSWEDIGQGLRELAAAGAAAGGQPDGVAWHTPQGRGDFIEPFLP